MVVIVMLVALHTTILCTLTAFLKGVASHATRTHTNGVAIIQFTEGTLTTRIIVTRVGGNQAPTHRITHIAWWTSTHSSVIRYFTYSIATTLAWILALIVDTSLCGWTSTVVPTSYRWKKAKEYKKLPLPKEQKLRGKKEKN